jgi:hypothetical protein
MVAAVAVAGIFWAGAAFAQTVEEAALCLSLTNVVIPDLEESAAQLDSEDVRPGSIDEIGAKLDLMRTLQTASQEHIEGQPQEWSEEDLDYLIMGGEVVMSARNPEAIRDWTAECRSMFNL